GQKEPTSLALKEDVQAPDLSNYFLLSMARQWKNAKSEAALVRADRALALAYEQTRIDHIERLQGAQIAIDQNKLDAALRLFEEAKQIMPHDKEAEAGIRVVAKLKDGTLTRDMLRKQLDDPERRLEAIKKTKDGKFETSPTK